MRLLMPAGKLVCSALEIEQLSCGCAIGACASIEAE